MPLSSGVFVPGGVNQAVSIQATDRCGFPNYPKGITNASNTSYQCCVRLRNMIGNIIDPQVWFGNYGGSTTAVEADGLNSVTYYVAIADAAYPADFYRLTAGGVGNYGLTLLPGQEAAFDVAQGWSTTSDLLVHMLLITPATGDYIPVDYIGIEGTTYVGEGYCNWTTVTPGSVGTGIGYDNTVTPNTFVYQAKDAENMPRPLRVMSQVSAGVPNSILIAGTSIETGIQDVNPPSATYPQVGYVQAGLATLSNTPVINLSQPGAKAADWETAASYRRIRSVVGSGITTVYDPCYTNDLNTSGTTQAIIDAAFIRRNAMWRAAGIKRILTATPAPKSTSSLGANLLASFTIGAGGTGYAASATFNVTLVGGTLSTVTGNPGTATILSVNTNSSGVVSAINSIVSIGYYTVIPSGTVATTGGTGSGLTIAIATTTLTFAGWIDVASQTVATGWGTTSLAQQVADNVRNYKTNGNPYGIDGMWDFSDVLSTARNSGIWRAGLCSPKDGLGIHPSTLAYHGVLATGFASFLTAQGFS